MHQAPNRSAMRAGYKYETASRGPADHPSLIAAAGIGDYDS
jgi:hypothetical protein